MQPLSRPPRAGAVARHDSDRARPRRAAQQKLPRTFATFRTRAASRTGVKVCLRAGPIPQTTRLAARTPRSVLVRERGHEEATVRAVGGDPAAGAEQRL